MIRHVSALAIAAACACGAHTAQPRSGSTDLLAYVPAETPYVAAGLEPFPLDAFDAYLTLFATEMTKRTAQKDGEDARMWRAIDKELGGDYSSTGRAKLGFKARPSFAVYGLGLEPLVARIELADGKALLAAVHRITAAAGVQFEAPQMRDGRSYWRMVKDDTTTLIAVLDDQLVIARGPTARIDAELPAILGITKPAHGFDRQILAEVAARHHFATSAVGMIDTGRLMAAYTSRTGPPTAACSAAIHAAAARMPRVVGSLVLDDKHWDSTVVAELDRTALQQLRALEVEVPGLAAELAARRFALLGGGLDLARAQQLAATVGAGMRALGEVCDWAKMVKNATELEDLARPLPPVVGAIRGGYVSLHAFSRVRADGVAVLSTSQGGALFQLAETFVPFIADLGLTADGAVHPLTSKYLATLPYKLFGAIGDRGIAIGAGDRGEQLVKDALDATGGGKVPLFVMAYDYARWQDVTEAFGGKSGPQLPDEIRTMFGQTVTRVETTEHGLAMRITAERNH